MDGDEIFIYEVVLYRGHIPELDPPEKFIVFRFAHNIGDSCDCGNGVFRPDYAYDILECDSCRELSPMRQVGMPWAWGHSILSWP